MPLKVIMHENTHIQHWIKRVFEEQRRNRAGKPDI